MISNEISVTKEVHALPEELESKVKEIIKLLNGLSALDAYSIVKRLDTVILKEAKIKLASPARPDGRRDR